MKRGTVRVVNLAQEKLLFINLFNNSIKHHQTTLCAAMFEHHVATYVLVKVHCFFLCDQNFKISVALSRGKVNNLFLQTKI